MPNVFALLDEVGAGKTKQVVDAAQVLFIQREIEAVCVVAPGNNRSTWADPDPVLGEVAKHAWPTVPNVVHEFHKHYTELELDEDALHWVITNYEFMRRDKRLQQLIKQLHGRRCWFVMDEAWSVKGFSDQMRACRQLRNRRADRVTILNGTPLADGKPSDLYYPFAILDPSIIGCDNRAHFRAKYCVVETTHAGEKVTGYQNLDELNARIAPYVLSRRTRDCFDLPPMLDPVTVEVKLSDTSWKIYRSMRDDLVTWLGGESTVARQAIVKILRLSQITSGFLGGLGVDDDPNQLGGPATTMPDWMKTRLPFADPVAPVVPGQPRLPTTKEIGREKLDGLMNWLKNYPQFPTKLLVWCRFRPELERTAQELRFAYPLVMKLCGGQSPEDREAAKRLLAPKGDPRNGAVVGTQKAGATSLNFAASNIAVYMSNGPSLFERTQSLGRIERPGAERPMLVVDIVATGPKGQKTIDHHTLKGIRKKEYMARWTVGEWRRILQEE